jgi:gag-polypeptide of LTR copia-type/Zinc knuckle
MPDEPRFPKLIEGNYEQWRTLMEATLVAGDLWAVVGPEDEELVYKGVKGEKEKKKKQQQARAKIVLELDPSQLPFVTGLEDPREMWAILESIHRSASVNSILSLRRHFFRMTKSETETTMSWISRVRAQALELTHTPCPVSDLDIILVITDGLPSTFETVVSSLDGLPFSKLTIPNVINRIMGHEAHIERMRNKRLDDPGAQAMVVHPSKRKKVVEKVVTCYRCGGKGHMASDCPSPPSVDEHANLVDDDEDAYSF